MESNARQDNRSFYEQALKDEDKVAAISSLFEPVLVVALGILIGIVVVAMYLPIFHLAPVI